MKPNPIDMLVFLEVAEARSFTAAASRIGRTTSAVSQAVARLEQELGSRLLYRTTRSLSLTDAGVRALSHCHELKDVYTAATAELSEAGGDPTGTLCVAAPHALCGSIVGPALQHFLSEHAGLSCRLIADDSPVDLVEHQIDLAIRIGDPSPQTARITKIGTLSKSLYCSPDFLDAKGGAPQSFSALETWDHIANEWQGSPVTYAGPAAQIIKVTPRFRCNSVLDVYHFAVAGAGVALLPVPIAESANGQDRLTHLFPISQTPVYAVHLFEGRPPPKVKKFIALLRKTFREQPQHRDQNQDLVS